MYLATLQRDAKVRSTLIIEQNLIIVMALIKYLLSTVSAPAKTTAGLLAQNDQQTKLRNCLFALMKQHPEGLTLPQVRLGCPDLVNPLVLKSYPSTRQLLGSLTDVVRLQGIGVQALVLPASRQNTDSKET